MKKDDYQYIYDPEHRNRPVGSDWDRTKGGWSSGKVDRESNADNELERSMLDGSALNQERLVKENLGWVNCLESAARLQLFEGKKALVELFARIENSNGRAYPDINELKELAIEKKKSMLDEFDRNVGEEKRLEKKKEDLRRDYSRKRNDLKKYAKKNDQYLEALFVFKHSEDAVLVEEAKARMKPLAKYHSLYEALYRQAEKLNIDYRDACLAYKEKYNDNSKYFKARGARDDWRHTVSQTVERDIEKFTEYQSAFENVFVKNLSQKSKEIVDLFDSPKNVQMLMNFITNRAGLFYGPGWKEEFSELEKEYFMGKLMENIEERSRFKIFNPFVTLMNDPKNYDEFNENGVIVKCFNLDKIPPIEFLKIFIAFSTSHIDYNLKAGKEHLHRERDFVPLIQQGDDDSFSLENYATGENPFSGGHEDELEGEEETITEIEDALVSNVSEIAHKILELMGDSLAGTKFGEFSLQAKKAKLEDAMVKFLGSYFTLVKKGITPSQKYINSILEMSLGGIDGRETELLKNNIWLMIKLVMYQFQIKKLEDRLNEYGEEDANAESSLEYMMDEVREMKRQLKAQDFAVSKITACVRKMLDASLNSDNRIEFLMENKMFPDGSGKRNN